MKLERTLEETLRRVDDEKQQQTLCARRAPDTSELRAGQLWLDEATQKLYIKGEDDALREITLTLTT